MLGTCRLCGSYSSASIVNRRQFVSQRRVHYARRRGPNQLERQTTHTNVGYTGDSRRQRLWNGAVTN